MFLGAFNEGSTVTYSITWTPDVDSPVITGSSVVFSQGPTVIQQAATADGPNTFRVSIDLPAPGNWDVVWRTDPVGGVAEGRVYIEAV
jgi:hypothetical protein